MINAQKLFEIAHSSPTAEAMFTSWALRERNRESLDVRRFRLALTKEMQQKGVQLDKEAFYRVMGQLQALGAGKVTHSVRGLPRFFMWKVAVKELGVAGIQGLANGVITPLRVPPRAIRHRSRKQVTAPSTSVPRTNAASSPGLRESMAAAAVGLLFVIPVSNGRVVSFNLPGNLSSGDIESIATGIRSLANKPSSGAA